MRNDVHFWIATLGRGILALLFGSAVIVIPDAAKLLLLMPFAVAVSVLLLATYGIVDSVLVMTTAFMAESRRTRLALLVQGGVGATVGILLLTVVFERFQLHWFLYIVAFQALTSGVGEFVIARHRQSRRRKFDWNYGAAAVAISAAATYTVIAFFYTNRLLSSEIAWALFAYLIAFGIAQCLTAARMLYADHAVMLIRRELSHEGETTHHVAISTGRSF